MLAKSLTSIDMVAAMGSLLLISGMPLLVLVLAAILSFFVFLKGDIFTVIICVALAWVSLFNPLFLVSVLLVKCLIFFSMNYFTFLDIAAGVTGALAITFGILTAVATVMMLYLYFKSFSMYTSL
jgi:hypothetical protein